jgi:7-cyano-7-deazaguanine synthase
MEKSGGAIVLFSGGLDSTVATAIAAQEFDLLHLLTFDYGQRNRVEVDRALAIAEYYAARFPLLWYSQKIHFGQWCQSLLLSGQEGSSYVPGRNTIFLAFALSLAEAVNAEAVFTGFTDLDHSPYPDVRPEYIEAMQRVYDLHSSNVIQIRSPLLYCSGKEVIRQGMELDVPFELTWSCYDPQELLPCLQCESCKVRARAFIDAGVTDPALYGPLQIFEDPR